MKGSMGPLVLVAGVFIATLSCAQAGTPVTLDLPQGKPAAQTTVAEKLAGAVQDGNLLLNIGPRADGSVPGPEVERLEAVGGYGRGC